MTEKERQSEFYEPALETMSRDKRQNYVNERIKWVVQYAYRNAPVVKAKLDEAGVTPEEIRTLSDLEKIPVTRKHELVELQKADPPLGGFLAVPIESLRRIYMSPGPIYEPQGFVPDAHHVAKALYTAGFRKGDRVINTFTYHLVPAGHGIDGAIEVIGATVIPTGVGNTELQVQIMHDLKVNGICTTPSFLMTIINKAEEMGYDVRHDLSLKRAFFTAEMLPPSLRQVFEQDYGISTWQSYAISDVGFVAYECSQKLGMHVVDEVAVEITDPATGKQLGAGEVGEVVVTHFSEIYPLIRFGTGDLSSYSDEPCPCGRTSRQLAGVLGRVGDAVKVRGMFIYPQQIKEVVAKSLEISEYQAIVTRRGVRDEITFKIELADETIDRERISKQLQAGIRDICRLKADHIEFVAKGTIPKEHKAIVDERTWE